MSLTKAKLFNKKTELASRETKHSAFLLVNIQMAFLAQVTCKVTKQKRNYKLIYF